MPGGHDPKSVAYPGWTKLRLRELHPVFIRHGAVGLNLRRLDAKGFGGNGSSGDGIKIFRHQHA